MLARLLKDRGVAVIEDGRAAKRDRFAPTEVTVRYEDETDVASLIDRSVASSPCPVAIVSDTARVFVLTAGGSGEIVVMGESPSEEQDAAALAVMEAVHDIWAIGQKAPTRRKKTKPVEVVEEVTEVTEAELADLAEFVQVLEAIADVGNDDDDS
jgi:hypothetical protein